MAIDDWPAVDTLRDALGDAARTRPGAAARLRAALVACQAFLDEELFPALRESVAGSDAVCIRDMQLRATGLYYACATSLPDTQDPELLLARSAQYLAYLADEPLAMAERLLV